LIAFGAYYLFNSEAAQKTRVVFWGSLILQVFLSTLITPFGSSGGTIGVHLFGVMSNIFGEVASILIMFILSLITIVVTFNISLKDFFGRVNLKIRNGSEKDLSGNEHRGISVFRVVRRKIGMGRDKQAEVQQAPPPSLADGNWSLPPIEILEESKGKGQIGDVNKMAKTIAKTMADFNIEITPEKANIGPTVTQFELKPADGVKLSSISARADDMALALAKHPIRVEAPIPGKSAVGVEVPNDTVAKVSLRNLIDSEHFKKRESNLTLPLGMDVAGEVISADLRKMPHLLVAGATGSGKSVGLNSFLVSLLYQNSPRDLRILLVDPKRVEFTMYNGIPHLLTPVVVEVDKTVNLLRWAISEMERRFKLFEQAGSRDIESYNEKAKKGFHGQDGTYHEKLPYIVITIDELADLMMQAANEVEAAIVRLAQLARATGMHLVVATQRPSVDVITGLIKANITSRVSFSVASQIDSRTIIDQAGAEKLLGNGDMLFLGGEYTKPKRVQGAFVSEKEVKDVTDFLKNQGGAIYDNSITEYREVSGLKTTRRGGSMGSSGGDGDDLLAEAKQLVVDSGTASASFLQRRLKVGYARAARLLDLMEEQGIVGPARGAKPRDILVDSIGYDQSEQQQDSPSDDYQR
jgi:S-DNA-T family DNA segregation ATPase FtsK/SpoIIIE